MRAADALRAAHTAGITVTLDGDGILLEADAEPPQALLEALARHKLAILTGRMVRCGLGRLLRRTQAVGRVPKWTFAGASGSIGV